MLSMNFRLWLEHRFVKVRLKRESSSLMYFKRRFNNSLDWKTAICRKHLEYSIPVLRPLEEIECHHREIRRRLKTVSTLPSWKRGLTWEIYHWSIPTTGRHTTQKPSKPSWNSTAVCSMELVGRSKKPSTKLLRRHVAFWIRNVSNCLNHAPLCQSRQEILPRNHVNMWKIGDIILRIENKLF